MRKGGTRHALVLLAGLLVVGLIAALLALPPVNQDDPSSTAAGRLGTLALYTWLDRLGLSVSRLSGIFSMATSDVLIEYDPTVTFSNAEADQVMAYLHRGGDLVLSLAPESALAAAPLLQRLQVTIAGETSAGAAIPVQPFDVTGRLRSVPASAGYSLTGRTGAVPLLAEDGAVVAVAVPESGGGRAYVLGNTAPLSNDGLRHGDSAFLVLALLERARGGRVFFDEYHHGETAAAATGAGAVFAGPLGVAAVLAVLLVLGFFAINGRRLGRADEPAEAAAPTIRAYLDAMSDLFARARHQGAVLEQYAEELKRRISAESGVNPHLDDRGFITQLRDAGYDPVALEALLARCRSAAAGNPDAATVLQLARDVDRTEREWSTAQAQIAQLHDARHR